MVYSKVFRKIIFKLGLTFVESSHNKGIVRSK